MNDTDVIIIGAGVAGLTAAVGLSNRGLNVTVLERSDALGGRAQSLTDPVTDERIDLGPHILVSQYRNFLKLLDELGMGDEVVWQDSPHLVLVDNPGPVIIQLRPLPAPLHLLPTLMKVPQISWIDLLSNRRVMWQILRFTETDLLDLDRLDAVQFLRERGVSTRAIDWFWRTAAMTILNTPLELSSAGALCRFIRFLSGRNDFLVGFAGVGLGDLFAPAAEQRITGANGTVRKEAEVAELLTGTDRVTGVRLKDGAELSASYVVTTVPPADLHPLIPTKWQDRYPTLAQLTTFKPSPYICTYLWFSDKLTQEPFWTKVWSPDNLNYDFYDLSNIKPALAGQPSLIASNCMHSVGSAALSDDEIVARTRAEIAEHLPAAAQSLIRHSRVHRIPMGIIQPAPGSESLRPGTTAAIPGLFLAGDWTNTGLPGSMESAARSGWLAAEQVLAAMGRPCPLAQPLPELTGLARWIGHSQAAERNTQ